MEKLITLTFWVLLLGWIPKICHSTGTGPCVIVEATRESLCIPAEAINEAFGTARHRLDLQPAGQAQGHVHIGDIERLGLALTLTTEILARQFGLSHDQIRSLLPELDLRSTDIPGFCPAQFWTQDKTCDLDLFRSLSGRCNNVNHPTWGSTLTPFRNLLPPHYTDGVSLPRGSHDLRRSTLPSPRVVSATVHQDAYRHDHSVTVMLVAWGQMIDHDITLTGDSKDTTTSKEPDCCAQEDHGTVHHNCFPIRIPPHDPFYGHYAQTCMNFARSLAGVRPDCRLGPRKAFNLLSSFLDANFVYGTTPEIEERLRVGRGGLLRSFPIFEQIGLKALLPLKTEEPDDGCIRHDPNQFCFMAGDVRVNEQLVLTVLHTIFMREHNRIAGILGEINPHWEDDRIFQETRQILIATFQHITYNEFLPMILGKSLMAEYGLELRGHGYWAGYEPFLDPTVSEEFVTSAFRFGHSLLPKRIERWSHGHRYIDSQPLHKLLRQPFDLHKPGYLDTYLLGMVNQLAQAMDEGVTDQVTTLLFKEPHKLFGLDLAAINMQRGREHGVPGYTAYRELCGLPLVEDWPDLVGVMRNDTVRRYASLYSSPADIDLWSGGVSELPAEGSLLGPTFGCLVAEQFARLRHGDRFWYELPDLPSSFTKEQLGEIRKVKLSRLLCDNSDDLKTIQIYAMVYPNPDTSPRVPCQGHLLPGLDLEKWREAPLSYAQYLPATLTVQHYVNESDLQYFQNLYDSETYRTIVPTRIETTETEVVQEVPLTLTSEEPGELATDLRPPPLIHIPETTESLKGETDDIHYESSGSSIPIVYKVPTVRARSYQKSRSPRLPPPFPGSPFPGWSGLFSPNPGYLVKQQFRVYRPPPYVPQQATKSLGGLWQKAFG